MNGLTFTLNLEGAEVVKHLKDNLDNDSKSEESEKNLPLNEADSMPINSNEEQENDNSANDEDFTIKLLELYRSLPATWNTKIKDYNDRTLKRKQYHILLKKYNARYPDANLKDLRRKINALRSCYRRELNRIPHGVSTLYYFGAMDFLRDIELICESPNRMHELAETQTTPEIVLDDAQYIILAEIYKTYTCLWDEKDIAYRFKNRRKEAMQRLREEFNNKSGLNLTQKNVETVVAALRKSCGYEKKRKIACKQKNLAFRPTISYYEHIAFLEVDVTPFECLQCGKLLMGSDAYKIHLSTHDGSLPFKCHICEHGFQLPTNLAVHLRRHVQDYTFKCEVCNKPCATTTELKVHMRTHTDERPFICDICGYKARTSSHLLLHTSRHLNRPRHKCITCSKMFYQKGSLIEHMKVHTSVRDTICDICKKGFKSKKQLGQHMHIHNKEKKYLCKLCEKRFAQHAGLSVHMKSHGTKLSANNYELLF